MSKYLNEIKQSLDANESAVFDPQTPRYILQTIYGEISFFENDFDHMIEYYNIRPPELINDCKQALKCNTKDPKQIIYEN